jgi:uncharacterized protein
MLTPIAENLYTDTAHPCLLGGKRTSDGEIVFPMPTGDAAQDYDMVELSRTGTLWSWTIQHFQPKPPYIGLEPFEPYALGYVELPGEVIVETRLIGTGPFHIGMHMELEIMPFTPTHSTFAFRTRDLP